MLNSLRNKVRVVYSLLLALNLLVNRFFIYGFILFVDIDDVTIYYLYSGKNDECYYRKNSKNKGI